MSCVAQSLVRSGAAASSSLLGSSFSSGMQMRGMAGGSRPHVPPGGLKYVQYTISPFETRVLSGLFDDLPGKAQRKIQENWLWGIVPFGFLGIKYASDELHDREAKKHRF